MKMVLVPVMLFVAGLLMSFAWIGHLKFRTRPAQPDGAPDQGALLFRKNTVVADVPYLLKR